MSADEAQSMLAENGLVVAYLLLTLTAGVLSLLFIATRDRAHWLAGRRAPGWRIQWHDFGLFVLLVVTVVLFAAQASARLWPTSGETVSIWSTIAASLAMSVAAMLAFILARRYFRSEEGPDRLVSIDARLGPSAGLAAMGYLASIPLLYIVASLWYLVLLVLGRLGIAIPVQPQPVLELITDVDSPWALATLLLMAVVLAPLWEELVFRAGIYRFLKTRVRTPFAMVVSGALFSFVHFHPVSFPVLMFVGIMLCLVYERTGDIRACMLFHAFFNANTLTVVFLQGGELPAASLPF